MLRLAKLGLLGVLVGVAWSALVVVAVLQGWLREPLASPGDVEGFGDAATRLLDAGNRGNVAFRLIDDGRVARDYFRSIGERVDDNTLFQVASLSKWISAWGVLTLVESGELLAGACWWWWGRRGVSAGCRSR